MLKDNSPSIEIGLVSHCMAIVCKAPAQSIRRFHMVLSELLECISCSFTALGCVWGRRKRVTSEACKEAEVRR